MKRDLLFAVEHLAVLLDEHKLAALIREHGIDKAKGSGTSAKLLMAFLRKADEGTLGRLLVEEVILLYSHSQGEFAKVLREAAAQYKVDIEVIASAVKQEFAAKARAKAEKKVASKPTATAANAKKNAMA